jgi:hypothetical protein
MSGLGPQSAGGGLGRDCAELLGCGSCGKVAEVVAVLSVETIACLQLSSDSESGFTRLQTVRACEEGR